MNALRKWKHATGHLAKIFQVCLGLLCQHIYLFKSVTKHAIDPENKLRTAFFFFFFWLKKLWYTSQLGVISGLWREQAETKDKLEVNHPYLQRGFTTLEALGFFNTKSNRAKTETWSGSQSDKANISKHGDSNWVFAVGINYAHGSKQDNVHILK